jgi:hypothetical protein
MDTGVTSSRSLVFPKKNRTVRFHETTARTREHARTATRQNLPIRHVLLLSFYLFQTSCEFVRFSKRDPAKLAPLLLFNFPCMQLNYFFPENKNTIPPACIVPVR